MRSLIFWRAVQTLQPCNSVDIVELRRKSHCIVSRCELHHRAHARSTMPAMPARLALSVIMERLSIFIFRTLHNLGASSNGTAALDGRNSRRSSRRRRPGTPTRPADALLLSVLWCDLIDGDVPVEELEPTRAPRSSRRVDRAAICEVQLLDACRRTYGRSSTD